MFCHKCGAQIAEGAGFCHQCGTKVIRTDNTSAVSNLNKHPIPPSKPPFRKLTTAASKRLSITTSKRLPTSNRQKSCWEARYPSGSCGYALGLPPY